MVVALAFGLSFYYGFVSTESAIANHVPELMSVASKLKSILMINTVGFVAIIIASFYILSMIFTHRMFRPLGLVNGNLKAISDGRLPDEVERLEEGVFCDLQNRMKSALDIIREKEKKELDELNICIKYLRGISCDTEILTKLETISDAKTSFLGASDKAPEERSDAGDSNSLFMQPV